MALTILSSVNEIYRRDVEVDTANLTDTTHSDCLVAGEWVALDATGKATISSDALGSGARTSAIPGVLQVFTQKGDYSSQALGRVTVLNSFDYIAETDQYTGSIAAGALVMVNSDGVLATASGTGNYAVGIALAAAASPALLKFQRVSPFQLN